MMVSPLNIFYWFLSTKYALCSLVEIDPVVLEKKMKMWKIYNHVDDNDNKNDNGNDNVPTWAFMISSDELKILPEFFISKTLNTE